MSARRSLAAIAAFATLFLGVGFGRSTFDEGSPTDVLFVVCAKDGVTVAHFYYGGEVVCGDGWEFVSVEGADGLDGVDGIDGADGANGANGVNGVRGPGGANGVDGTNGMAGVNGANGADGVDGTNGMAGANGADGVDGTNGLDGLDGANGLDGINAGDVAISLWFRDRDGDGYGDENAGLADLIVGGPQPVGFAPNLSDCDDTRSSVHPGATEIAGDGIDQNCDGSDPAPLVPANSTSTEPSVSATGRYVAFTSRATNLVAGSPTSGSQVFVRDTVAGVSTVVSVGTAGALGNATSRQPSISDDGRYVAFSSNATNLVAGHSGTHDDVYVRDLVAGTTVLVSPRGAEAAAYSWRPEISGDGSAVVFDSTSSTLVPGDVNGLLDSFRWRRVDDSLTLASVSTGGAQGDASSAAPSVSGDGLFVAFESGSTTLATVTPGVTNVFMRDVAALTTSVVSLRPGSAQAGNHSHEPSVSGDGRFVAFNSRDVLVAGDTNNWDDVFVRDRQTSTTWRASVSTSGTQGNASATYASLSAGGQVVAFDSTASTLVAGDTNGVEDVFASDRAAGTTVRVSVSDAGVQANARSRRPSISADGRYIAYFSTASNLVPGDTNATDDVFLFDLLTGQTLLVSAAAS